MTQKRKVLPLQREAKQGKKIIIEVKINDHKRPYRYYIIPPAKIIEIENKMSVIYKTFNINNKKIEIMQGEAVEKC